MAVSIGFEVDNVVSVSVKKVVNGARLTDFEDFSPKFIPDELDWICKCACNSECKFRPS